MDAEREAREIVNDYRGYPDWWEQQRCYDTLELRIAAALRRAHAAGRREAVERCAKVADGYNDWGDLVRRETARDLTDAIRALLDERRAAD